MFLSLTFKLRIRSYQSSISRCKRSDEARKILSSQANLTIRDANDKVKLTGKDIVQGSAKQEFKQGTNEPAVTFKLKIVLNLKSNRRNFENKKI